LIGQGNIGAQLIFQKYLFWAYIGVLKVKSYFSTYFSIETDTGIQKILDFGCGFGFFNPKSKLNQNIQKNKKPHPKPNHKIKKIKNQIQNQSRFLVY
jgi:hypothetical protein